MSTFFRFILLSLIASFTVGASAQELESDLQAQLKSQQLTGLVVATVQGGSSRQLALGVAHSGTKQPLALDSRVQVGSIAKTVLALAVLRLVSQGRLDLDAPVLPLLPTLQLDNPWAAQSPLRVRHLLDMSGGVPDLQLWHLFNRSHSADQPLALALRAEHGPIRLRSEPGTRFSYSNLSFTLAAMVLEAVTQERYETWAARELLLPLGMLDSSFSFRTQADDKKLAWGHLDAGQPEADMPVAVRPAAYFVTTAADMTRLMQFLLGDGRLSSRPPDQPAPHLLRPDLMAAMGRASTTDAARAGLHTGYGLGLSTRDRHGAVGLCHGGSVAGWRAMFCVYREAQQGFFMVLNQDREDGLYLRFEERLVQHLGVSQAPATVPPRAGVEGREGREARQGREYFASRAADRAWSGIYVPAPGRLQALALPDRLAGFWQLDLQAEPATLRQGFGAPRALLPAGDGLYRQPDRQQATLALLRDGQGQPLVASGYLTLRRVSGIEQALLMTSAATGVLAALAVLPLAAWRRWRRDTSSLHQPAAWALLLLLGALLLWALGWRRLGEFTLASALLMGATLLWTLACAAQALQAWQHRRTWPVWWLDGAVALAGWQLCVLLLAYGWWPLMAWRL